MRGEKVWFSLFVLLALTLNFGYVYGEIDNPLHHDYLELFLTFVVSIICTLLKLGDRTHLGALLLATSLVADAQLSLAIAVSTFSTMPNAPQTIAMVVSFAAGALIANMISVLVVVIESSTFRR